MINDEKAETQAVQACKALHGMDAHEPSKIKGRYMVTALEPRPERRTEYILLRNQVDQFIRSGIDSGSKLIQAMRERMESMLTVAWEQAIENVVTTAGKNMALDTLFAGSAYTAAWYVGLISSVSYTGVPVAADTMASHSTWTEDVTYSNSARPTAAWASASAGSKALSSAASFTCNGTATIKGCFLTTIATKGGTTGTLYSAGLFTGGDQPVTATTTLQVAYTASLT